MCIQTRSFLMGCAAALLIAPLAGAYSDPSVVKDSRPVGSPADNRYFKITTDGIDANNPFQRLYVEINQPAGDANDDGNVDEHDHPMKGKVAFRGAGPRGWTVSVASHDNKVVLCFDHAEGNVTSDTTFRICVEPNGAKKAKISGTGKHYYLKNQAGNLTPAASGTGTGRIVLLASVVPDPPCLGDLTDDGVVSGADLGTLLADWGGPGVGDLDGDGETNGADLGVLLSSWGPCPVATSCGPDSASCCQPGEQPGCGDAACCTFVCEDDPFCCEAVWDELCAQQSIEVCGCDAPFIPSPAPCFKEHEFPGCDDPALGTCVCDIDSYCCAVEWDQLCVQTLLEVCLGQ